MRMNYIAPGIIGIIIVIMLCVLTDETQAVPSYARQTNLPCNSCHTIFPELKEFGRLFKLNGYTLTGIRFIESESGQKQVNLKLSSISPLSAMVQSSFTHFDKTLPRTQNNDVSFPQYLSFFVAGEITPRIGTFIRVTYTDKTASFYWDNTDIRFADHLKVASKDLIYGVTLNNNPTVQDVWNSTPVWGFPYLYSSIAPVPVSTLIQNGLARQVAGLGGYIFYDRKIYGEFTMYRSARQGGPHPPDGSSTGIIKNVSPYWRLALQHQWSDQYLEIGTYGLYSQIYPQGIAGSTNKYTDIAFDAQYDHVWGNTYLTAHTTYIHEHQNLETSYFDGIVLNRRNNLNTFKIDGNIYFMQKYAAFLGYFLTSGNEDRILYYPAPIRGSRTRQPDSGGFVAQFDFLPWYNTKFSLQYTIYTKFNGASENYDGYGRNASGNNTLYLLAWLNF
ncbi:MAG: cytochrome C [Calditrichia bacterium]